MPYIPGDFLDGTASIFFGICLTLIYGPSSSSDCDETSFVWFEELTTETN
jgi:hypothetical protein